MKLFSLAFFLQALDASTVAGAAAFAGALNFTGGSPSLKGLEAAAIGAGVAFLATFLKQYGAVQAVKAQAKAAAE